MEGLEAHLPTGMTQKDGSVPSCRQTVGDN